MKNKEVKKVLTSRIFAIMQYEYNPETGKPLISLDIIKIALAHKTISKYAYVYHNKDKYTKEDEEKNPKHKAGDVKPPHYHIVIEMKVLTPLETIANWFCVENQYVEMKKGRGAFLDCVQYLTHEHENQVALGKHRYKDKEICANFDFRTELDKYLAQKIKYGKCITDKEQMRLNVLLNGMTLIQCQEENALLYSEDMEKLKKLRLQYLYNQNPPTTRINYYISGRGGLGKGLCSRALARSLFPDLKNDDEIFFIVGDSKATFEGYDGQPVIIWDDMRAFDLLTVLGSRGNVFNVLDTHPTKQRQNIKYGSINLCNTVNIINSVQSYIEFLDGLAGEYTTKGGEVIKSEDKNQSYRRVPFIINLHESDFDLLVNRGFMEHNKNFQEYDEYKNITGNFQKVRVALRQNEELAKKIESNMLQIPKQKYDEVIIKNEIEIDEDEVLKQFADYGKMPTQMTIDDLKTDS